MEESTPLDPRNTYAATKVTQEHLGAIWARETGGSAISLRLHNVYGPGMPRNTPYAGVASLFSSALDRNEAPRVFEDGGQRRDFVHVSDVAHAFATGWIRGERAWSAGGPARQHNRQDRGEPEGDGDDSGVVSADDHLVDVPSDRC